MIDRHTVNIPQPPLTTFDIKERLKKYCNEELQRLQSVQGRKAAVLIPLFWEGGEWHVLFTRRSEELNDHKGQVSFPGGAVEPADGNIYRAALREAHEEIGLESDDVEILGRLKDYSTVSNFVIAPVVGRILWPFEMRINHVEVSRVFTVPLSFMADKNHIETQMFTYPDGRRTRVFYFTRYDGELVWGITARIMIRLLKVLGLLEENY
jgi:8-oxo-dGTP pyrophosphatase MutT (NUDIX family)